MAKSRSAAPKHTLSVSDGIAMLIGIMIGIGIFRAPSIVAQNVSSETMFIAVWLFGGLVTLVGALCYAELGSANPHHGGEYHFLSRAYGHTVGLLFAWARGSVIQTGAIAAVAFVYGDYANSVISLGAQGPAIHAAIAVAVFTAINLVGTRQGTITQHIFTVLDVLAILIIVVAGLYLMGSGTAPKPAVTSTPPLAALGLAMVFVLLTYGGWNEASYLSAELKDVRKNMARTLVISTLFVVVVYVLVNLAYLGAMGLQGLRNTNTAAADLMRMASGNVGATILSLFICCAALSTLNASIFTGGRIYYALGRDIHALRILGVWNLRGRHPYNGLVLQGIISLALVALGALTPDGFRTMVEYTAPVFWTFMLLVGIAVFIFRQREPNRKIPFRVPLYPLTPIIFCASCLWMLYSSLAYTGLGAFVGVAVLIAGIPLLLVAQWERGSHSKKPQSKKLASRPRKLAASRSR